MMLKTLCFSVFFMLHPVHVSFTSIDYVPGKDTFNVFVRMYYDDFIADCKLDGEIPQTGNKTINNSVLMDDMEKYLKERVEIKVNDKELSGKLIDLNKTDNEISMNLEYKTVKRPKSVTIKNQIMTDLYRDQINMVIIRINDFEEGIKLTYETPEQTIILKKLKD